MASWHPATYLQFRDERSRPFFDLLSMVGATDPSAVVDLGCGPGHLTATLAERWPSANILGLDSSREMIDEASQHSNDRVEFEVADLATWQPVSPLDVIVSNATLQWVPGHRDLLPRLVSWLDDGGWLAFQVPGNFGEPSHQLLRDLAAQQPYGDVTRGVAYPDAFAPETYLADLAALGCDVEAWETTYLHILTGPDPVFRWISGTGARPVLQALKAEHRDEFEADYKRQLREAYPEQSFGTVLPFRRVFAVARKL